MKTLLVVLVLLALLGTHLPAIGADGATHSQLVPFQQDGKFGFKDGTGRVAIEPIYDDAGSFAFGLAPVNAGARLDYRVFPTMRHGGKWGYIDERGVVVVPLTLTCAREFSDGLAQVRDERAIRFIDTNGSTTITLEKNTNVGDFSEGVAPIHLDGSLRGKDWQTKFIDRTGATVFTIDGYAEEFHEGLAALALKGEEGAESRKCGYIDLKGKVVITLQFAEAYPFSEGLAAVRTRKTGPCYGMGDTWGYIDKTGQYVLRPQYNEAHSFRHSVARVHVGGTLQQYEFHSPPAWDGGEWQLIDRQGEVLKRSPEWVTYDDAPQQPQEADPDAAPKTP